jgi:hypothetical protein
MDPSDPVQNCEPTTADRSSRANRRRAIAALVLACVFVTGASAASLGGLGGRSLGADRGTVASCDTNGVRVVYGPNTFNPSMNAFTVGTLSIRGIAAACRGRTLFVTLRDGSNGALASLSAVVAAGRVDFTLSPAVRVSQLAGVVAAIT